MMNIPFTPDQIFIMATILFAVLILAVLFFARKSEPYERVSSILTTPEQYFYKALYRALQGRALIMCKVRIADLINVRRSITRTDKNFWRYFSQISQKHIDFVLIDKQTFTTICTIELDDKSHARFERMKRDQFVNQIMKQTGITLYRFPIRRRYDFTVLIQLLK